MKKKTKLRGHRVTAGFSLRGEKRRGEKKREKSDERNGVSV